MSTVGRPKNANGRLIADVGVDQENNNISIANGSDGIANQQVNDSSLPGGHNQVATEQDRSAQADDNSEEAEPCIRGTNMGKALQRLSRARRGKLSVVITEGRKRPIVPLVAAKFATLCNIAVRNHVPVLKNWKEYRKHPGLLKTFMGKLAIKFNINIDDPPVKKACNEMMKTAVRQQRYRLKKQYFNPYPLNMVTEKKQSKQGSGTEKSLQRSNKKLMLNLNAC